MHAPALRELRRANRPNLPSRHQGPLLVEPSAGGGRGRARRWREERRRRRRRRTGRSRVARRRRSRRGIAEATFARGPPRPPRLSRGLSRLAHRLEARRDPRRDPEDRGRAEGVGNALAQPRGFHDAPCIMQSSKAAPAAPGLHRRHRGGPPPRSGRAARSALYVFGAALLLMPSARSMMMVRNATPNGAFEE